MKSVDFKKALDSKRNDSISVERQETPNRINLRRLSDEELPKAFSDPSATTTLCPGTTISTYTWTSLSGTPSTQVSPACPRPSRYMRLPTGWKSTLPGARAAAASTFGSSLLLRRHQLLLRERNSHHRQRPTYRKETIFPLRRSPLGGLFLYTPFDTYLTHTYTNIALCLTSYYDHRSERVYEGWVVMITTCQRLRSL